MKRKFSLRTSIALCTAAITAAALVVLAIGTSVYVYFEDLEAIDEHLIGESNELIAEFASGTVDSNEFSHDEFEPRLGMAVFTAEGNALGISPSFPPAIARAGLHEPGFSIRSDESSRWRVHHATANDLIVSVGHNLDEFDDVLIDLVSIQFLLVPVVAAITAWISWLVAGRSLAPIRIATASAAQIGINDLNARLPMEREDDEVGQFTHVLNRMLDRIEKNYLQAMRFAGDASHELRTPLTIIKGELENLLTHNGLPPAAEQRIVSAQQEVDRMQQIIDQLLLLARFDTGKASSGYAAIEVSQLLDELGEDVDLLGAKSELRISHQITPGIRVRGEIGRAHV